MGRLIDADELLNSERERCGWEPVVGTCTQNNLYLVDVLKNAKTVDAEPVQHGKWIRGREQNIWGGFHSIYKCSVCGNFKSGNEVITVKHENCPNCRAIMDLK